MPDEEQPSLQYGRRRPTAGGGRWLRSSRRYWNTAGGGLWLWSTSRDSSTAGGGQCRWSSSCDSRTAGAAAVTRERQEADGA